MPKFGNFRAILVEFRVQKIISWLSQCSNFRLSSAKTRLLSVIQSVCPLLGFADLECEIGIVPETWF